MTKIASKVEIVIADVKLEGTLVWTHLVEMGAVADLAGGRLVDSSFFIFDVSLVGNMFFSKSISSSTVGGHWIALHQNLPPGQAASH